MAALTSFELDVLRGLFAGATNKEVAAARQVSEQTVKNHLTAAYRKLGVRGKWASFNALGWTGTSVLDEQVRITALRVKARAEIQALLDAVGGA